MCEELTSFQINKLDSLMHSITPKRLWFVSMYASSGAHMSKGICMGDPHLVIIHFAERVFVRAYKHGVFERTPVRPPNLVN